LDCVWDGAAAGLSDLSWGGCYVDSRYVPTPGTATEVMVMREGRPVILQGIVVHADRGVGFAMRFTGLSEPALEFLRSALGEHSTLARPPQPSVLP
jgi:hypothetical protein